MGRLLLQLNDSVSRKKNKNKQKDAMPVKATMFMFAIAAATLYSATMGFDQMHGTSSTPERHAYQRKLEECDATTTVAANENTTTTATPAAPQNYPTDLFSAEERSNGAILLHCLGIVYMFLGIAIICDDFFEASLEHLVEYTGMSDDVAGATFMAAGGSAPELFTSIMGVFVAKSDVGFGTIIGSAVFNVLFVIALCAWAVPNLPLTWWPLCRDSTFYCFSILVLTACAIDQQIWWWESVILLFCYGLYVTVMAFNLQLRDWTAKKIRYDKGRDSALQKGCLKFTESNLFAGIIYIIIVANVVIVGLDAVNKDAAMAQTYFVLNLICSILFIFEMAFKMMARGAFGYWAGELNAFDGVLVVLVFVEWAIMLANGQFGAQTTSAGAMRGVKGLRGMKVFRFLKIARCVRFVRLIKLAAALSSGAQKDQVLVLKADGDVKVSEGGPAQPSEVKPVEGGDAKPEGSDSEKGDPEKGEAGESKEGGDEKEGGEEGSEEDEGAPWPWPLKGSETPEDTTGKIMGIINFPLIFAMCLTVPHPDREKWGKWWPVTFIMCIVWIAGLAFFMVWWAELLGQAIGIPPAIMGLTLLAGGTSIPDAMSSIAVAKRGHGDMAVSSSIGSNVFDILLGLPLPWFMYTVFVTGGVETVPIYSSNMSIMILTLFIMVSLVITIVHWANWKLTVGLGWAMMVMYFVFLVQSLLLEYGLLNFGGSC